MNKVFQVYCNDDIVDVNQNFFKILGVGYGGKYIKWKKNTFYKAIMADDLGVSIGTYIYVESETNVDTYHPLKKNFFNKCFSTIDEVRDRKIEQLLT